MTSPSNTAAKHSLRFLVLEGVDGSGKSTQAALLAEWYRQRGYEVVLTREPGGTALAERLRALILDPAISCTARAELLMLLAARAQHVAELIAPALQAGKIVISDRFSLSTLAYQGYGRGLPLDEIRAVDHVATGGLTPDLSLVIDVPLEVALARIGERRDRFEGEGRQFLQRVIDGYHAVSTTATDVLLVDGTASIDQIQQDIREIISRRKPPVLATFVN